MPRKLIAGNWKMNGLRSDGSALARDLALRFSTEGEPSFDLLLCPPSQLLDTVGQVIAGSGVALGGQDCHRESKGAFTGDVSAAMLADIGCRYVINGHSERRQYHGEIDLMVAEKAAAAHGAGLVAVICIGETEDERDAGEALAICARQIAGSVPEGATAANTVIAYEPVWAIGTGRIATPAHAERRGRRGDARPYPCRVVAQGSRCRRCAHSLWRFGQGVQRGGASDPAECRRGAGRRSQLEGRRILDDRQGGRLTEAGPLGPAA